MRNLVVLFIQFHRHPDPVARTWRRLFPSYGVASSQAPTPDCESLPATISESIRVGRHPGRLDGALGASNSSAPFRNCTEALDTARPSQVNLRSTFRAIRDSSVATFGLRLLRPALTRWKGRRPKWQQHLKPQSRLKASRPRTRHHSPRSLQAVSHHARRIAALISGFQLDFRSVALYRNRCAKGL
jgi:hypothetical protein